jgi:transposase
MKDARTRLAHKPEHALDLDTGAVVATEMHAAERGDTATLPYTLASAARHLDAVAAAPSPAAPAELVADKGYHSRETLKALDDGPWKTRIAEPKRDGFLRWHGDDAARRAVVNNHIRLLSGVVRTAFKLRAGIVERCFALVLDCGGMRRTWLRRRENIHKRYLIHVAGYNLGLIMIMRLLTGAGTPREFYARLSACLAEVIMANGCPILLLIVAAGDQTAAIGVRLEPDPLG